jgi:osmoprotectant transport system ATP-binding protein
MIRLERVSKQYPDGTMAVHELTLDVPLGRVCVLVGPSGCGKTTTMRMINRLVEPTSGRIFVGGQDVTAIDLAQLRRSIGYVIQQVGLFPHLTVRRNVATVPNLLGWDRSRIRARVDEMLELIGLDPSVYGDRYPHQLSGGQRQRVGVARALAADPPVLLMDEPFGAVDPIARVRLQDEFLKLQRTVRKSVVFVTHDIDEAVRLGDRIAVMREGGHLEQYDEPGILLAQPVSEFVAEFVGNDRSIKRLAVTPIDVSTLAPMGPGDEQLAAVSATSTLRDATAAVLDDPRARVRVVRDGTDLGVLSLDSVHRALRGAPRPLEAP